MPEEITPEARMLGTPTVDIGAIINSILPVMMTMLNLFFTFKMLSMLFSMLKGVFSA